MSNVARHAPAGGALADAAHAVGAVILVDGAQLVPHHPVDVTALDVDFLTISGHKMLGPTASGGLYGRREVLERDGPVPRRRRDDPRGLSATGPRSRTLPYKFEAGTMNIAEEIGLGVAVDYLDGAGDGRRARARAGAHRLRHRRPGRRRRDGLRPDGRRASAAAPSRSGIEGVHPHDVAQILDTEGVCVRAGHHCAQPLMRVLGVPATTRASF